MIDFEKNKGAGSGEAESESVKMLREAAKEANVWLLGGTHLIHAAYLPSFVLTININDSLFRLVVVISTALLVRLNSGAGRV